MCVSDHIVTTVPYARSAIGSPKRCCAHYSSSIVQIPKIAFMGATASKPTCPPSMPRILEDAPAITAVEQDVSLFAATQSPPVSRFSATSAGAAAAPAGVIVAARASMAGGLSPPILQQVPEEQEFGSQAPGNPFGPPLTPTAGLIVASPPLRGSSLMDTEESEGGTSVGSADRSISFSSPVRRPAAVSPPHFQGFHRETTTRPR